MKLTFSYLLIFLLLLSLLVQGCSNLLLPDFVPDPMAQYPHKAKNDELVVVAQPFTDAQINTQYFGIDFKDMGYMPLLLIVKNVGKNNSFILKKENVSIKIRNPDENNGADLDKQLADQQEELGDAAIVTAYMLFPLFSMLALNDKLNLKEVERSLLENEFQTSTISPGKEVHGFVYMKLPEKMLANTDQVVVVVNAYNITNRQTDQLEVLISQKGDANASAEK